MSLVKDIVLNGVSWPEIAKVIGTSTEVRAAMVHAEKYGQDRVNGATITHVGYEAGVSEYNACTGLYRLAF